MRNYLLLGAALSCVLAATGCASPRIAAAQKLGTAGAEASAGLLTAATDVETGFQESLRQDTFLRSLQVNTPPATLLPNGRMACYVPPGQPSRYVEPTFAPEPVVDKVAASLRARTGLARSLGQTYAAWNSLAEYDAYGQVQAGVDGVFGATNTLRAAWDLQPISKGVGAAASGLAGAFASDQQARRLHAASLQISTALKGYREALERGRQPTVSTMQNRVGQRYALTTELWQRGYLDADALIGGMGQAADLKIPPSSAGLRFNASDEGLCMAVRGYLEGEKRQRMRAAEEDYEGQIEVIDSLIALHERFERGDGMSVEHLDALIDRLTTIAGLLGPEEED